jgi:hypothetical protein
MANLFNGTDIILDQVEGALTSAKEEGKLSIDYTKIRSFAKAFDNATGSGFQFSKFDAKPLIFEVCGKCGISGNDRETIKKILTD